MTRTPGQPIPELEAAIQKVEAALDHNRAWMNRNLINMVALVDESRKIERAHGQQAGHMAYLAGYALLKIADPNDGIDKHMNGLTGKPNDYKWGDGE